MTTIVESRQVRRARERAEAKAKAKAQTTKAKPSLKLDLNSINSINEQIVTDLQDPKFGYKLIYQFETDDGYVRDGKFSVYAPDYRRSMEKRADILLRTFGGYEATVFQIVKSQEKAGEINPFTGSKTYDAFDGGMYDLCIGVWEPKYGDNESYIGSDKISLPVAKYALFPMLAHDRGGDKQERMFSPAYGDAEPLNNLHSMIARANFSTKFTSPFNTARISNVDHILQNLWGHSDSDAARYNWLFAYYATYRMYRATLGGGNGSIDVKVTAGNRDDVVKGALNLHRVMD